MSMPMPERLRLEDQQSLFPMRQARRQEKKPEAVAAGKVRFLHLASEDDQLWGAQQSILCDQLGTSEREIRRRAQKEGRASGLSEMTQDLIQQRAEMGFEVKKERQATQNSSS